MASFLLLAMAALSTPALARPTTPCDETPGCQNGLRPEGQEDRDVGGAGRPDDVVEKRRTQPQDDDDGGSDIGGL